MNQPFILFITGSSASGKSSLYESLRGDTDFNGIEFHDIDENGVPVVGRGPWRKFRVEQLLYEAAERQKAGVSSIICGITLPHEVIESRYYRPHYNVYFLVVEASTKQIRERLTARIDDNVSKDIYDESFNKTTRREIVVENLKLRKLLRNSIDSLRHGYRIDASKLSKQELHDKTKQIIGKLRK